MKVRGAVHVGALGTRRRAERAAAGEVAASHSKQMGSTGLEELCSLNGR